MKAPAVVKAIAVVVAALALAPAALACTPRASQASLETKLVCIQCHTTLDESSSPFANELKAEVARRIALCQSEQQILDAMVAEFGPGVLSTPQTHGFDLIAWILPLGGIALGAAGLAFGARYWSRSRSSASVDSSQSPGLDPEDERRVDEELARFDD
jgi:cytochrome c-type biogenesis protein CcmH